MNYNSKKFVLSSCWQAQKSRTIHYTNWQWLKCLTSIQCNTRTTTLKNLYAKQVLSSIVYYINLSRGEKKIENISIVSLELTAVLQIRTDLFKGHFWSHYKNKDKKLYHSIKIKFQNVFFLPRIILKRGKYWRLYWELGSSSRACAMQRREGEMKNDLASSKICSSMVTNWFSIPIAR